MAEANRVAATEATMRERAEARLAVLHQRWDFHLVATQAAAHRRAEEEASARRRVEQEVAKLRKDLLDCRAQRMEISQVRLSNT